MTDRAVLTATKFEDFNSETILKELERNEVGQKIVPVRDATVQTRRDLNCGDFYFRCLETLVSTIKFRGWGA